MLLTKAQKRYQLLDNVFRLSIKHSVLAMAIVFTWRHVLRAQIVGCIFGSLSILLIYSIGKEDGASTEMVKDSASSYYSQKGGSVNYYGC